MFEHRKIFLDEIIKAYLYVSSTVKAITRIMELGNRVSLEDWKQKYSYDNEAVERIEAYLKSINM